MWISAGFDPDRDGWSFANWGEKNPWCMEQCEFSWDLFRQTYLGISESPEDFTFYQIFKNCATKGNCGGMSLMALALYKYGGYMGFCGPASCFEPLESSDYPDLHKSPKDPDLHRAINVLQARQFSAPGIQSFLDIVSSGSLSNAEVAFNKIKAQLGNGDYAILSLAADKMGDVAHTVIPYAMDDNSDGLSTKKTIYIWDPNYPTWAYENRSYGQAKLTISGPFDWEYVQGYGTHKLGTHYSCRNDGDAWCFATPMSVVMHKARHPIALDMMIEGLTLLFVQGGPATVTQIEDEHGHRFYKVDAEEHVLRSDIETRSKYRLPDVGRWPWFGNDENTELPGELYFLRRPVGGPAVQITLRGAEYTLTYVQTGNIVEVQAQGEARARDVVRLSGVATNQQGITLETDGTARSYDICQQRLFGKVGGWRSMVLQDVKLGADKIDIQSIGDFQAVEISSHERRANFGIELKQHTGRTLTTRSLGRQGVSTGRTARFTPLDWNELEKTEVQRTILPRR